MMLCDLTKQYGKTSHKPAASASVKDGKRQLTHYQCPVATRVKEIIK